MHGLSQLIGTLAGGRTAFLTAKAAIWGCLIAVAYPWCIRTYEGLFSNRDFLYTRAIAGPAVLLSLVAPLVVILADLVAHLSARLTRQAPRQRPLVLACEMFFLLIACWFIIISGSLSQTFGLWPRPWLLGGLALYYVAFFLAAPDLRDTGYVFVITPVAGLARAWPEMLPAPAALVLGVALVAAYATLRARIPKPLPVGSGFALGPVAATLVATGTFVALAFTHSEYTLAQGMNLAPNLLAWKAGCFARVERGCRATLEIYPNDPVSRTFLADSLIQQGRADEARALLDPVIATAGGSTGSFAKKLRSRLALQEAVIAELARTLAAVEPPCGGLAGRVRAINEMIDRAAKDPQSMHADASTLAAQFLPEVRAAARTAPGCRDAHRLRARLATLMAHRVTSWETARDYLSTPGDPRSADLLAEAATATAAAGDPPPPLTPATALALPLELRDTPLKPGGR